MNTTCLLVQSQEKIQLDYKTDISKNHQKIELYGSLTTKELKKPHSSRQVTGWRGRDTQRGPGTQRRGLGSPIPTCGE